MKIQRIAILITCYNRVEKTLTCLSSLFTCIAPEEISLNVFLVDDLSPDKTGEKVSQNFPNVKMIYGTGSLFWAGGMRLAWETAILEDFDYYLLLNDDVILKKDALITLWDSKQKILQKTNLEGIITGSTIDQDSREISYGGHKITLNNFIVRLERVIPKKEPLPCQITNANILLISKSTVKKIGIFDSRFTHGMADYDYSYNAYKKGIPVYVATKPCGYCTNDNGKAWKASNFSLKERIQYMKSPKGLAYSEYLYYVRKNFPLYYPYSITMLWIKTLFPFLWEFLK